MTNSATKTPLFPATAGKSGSGETQTAVRTAVRDLLENSEAFQTLDPVKRRDLAHNLVQIGTYLAEPDGVRVPPSRLTPSVRALAGEPQSGSISRQSGSNVDGEGKFTAQGAREGAAVAGALLEAVNFPDFVAGLVNGVFHSIVQSSMEQMEAYAKLVADVAKSLNQFRDDNVSQNQGRDHLIEQFPDVFQLTVDTGAFDSFGLDEESGKNAGPRVTLKEGVDERSAIDRINNTLPLDKPITSLDDELVEALLVPAARTQLASGRQQLLATMVTLGINRIVVTDGKISAKVMYDFQARDNMQFRKSAQQFDYGDQAIVTESVTDGEIRRSGPTKTTYKSRFGGNIESRRDSSFYTKGDYKSTSQPVLKLVSASQSSIDASLTTKASLAGSVEVNFKSDYLPLDKLANPESIAAIQMNAQPGMVKTIAKSRPATGTGAPTPQAGTTPAR